MSMSATFEPREVEKPFRMRWVRMTLQLMLRAPLRFSIAILLLGFLDAFALNLLPGAIPAPWAPRLGQMLLPLAWVVVAAMARGADDASQNWKALRSLNHPRVWMAALAIGIGLVTLSLVIQRLLFPELDLHDEQLRSGRILDLTGAQAWMVMTAGGICFFPLLVLEPALSFPEVLRLSKSATEINGRHAISKFMLILMCAAGVTEMLGRAWGLTSAVWIVFTGVINYVAYRDIFERRSENAPAAVASRATSAASTHGLTQAGSLG
jgi:hypothetical protein